MFSESTQKKLKKELCEILLRINALNFGLFTLPSGKLSPYYINLRVVTSFPDVFSKIANLYLALAKTELNLQAVKRIAGIPTAGIPFASSLALSLKKPFLYARKEETHGRERRVEGILNPGDVILIVDDLVTTGKTLLLAADAIRSEGGIVADALVLIDRQEGGRQALEVEGVKLHHLLLMSEVAKILYESGAIDEKQLTDISKQIIT